MELVVNTRFDAVHSPRLDIGGDAQPFRRILRTEPRAPIFRIARLLASHQTAAGSRGERESLGSCKVGQRSGRADGFASACCHRNVTR
jgi:hypothetical protein